MSAANASAPSSSLHEEMRAHEPSMEEILASIRRIIADDETLPGKKERREPPPVAVETAPAQSAYPAPALEPVDEKPAPATEKWFEPAPQQRVEPAPVVDIQRLRPTRAPDPEPALAYEPEPEPEAFEEEAALEEDFAPVALRASESPAVETNAPLVSADAASSVASHFQALAASMVINDSGLLHKYAQEMLRPMLKAWLDDNLPVIVERLVRAEIERVARGRR